MPRPTLAWLHIGDLHLTTAGEPNHRDLQRIVALANALPQGALDFAFLPGDCAEDGPPAQFQLVRDTLSLHLPLHITPGDHDFKQRPLAGFYATLGIPPLPYAITLQHTRCLFLDLVSAGAGGPDFRLGDAQLDWAEREADAAAGQAVALFMHTYPADLRAGRDRLLRLLARPNVLCVDMGHTHYNELANDGSTVFMATRSTGQVEEGPPGFSIAAIDAGGISWRFKPCTQPWPFTLITHPTDRRLAIRADPAASRQSTVRAKIVGDAPVRTVELQADDGPWSPMTPVSGATLLWEAPCAGPASTLRVRARDAQGREDTDQIELAGPDWVPTPRAADGSDRDRLEAWPEKGLLGTQLGPNRRGRKW